MRYITRCFVCFSLLVLICVSAGARQAPPQDDIISTYAGGGPNNLPAINASLDYAQGIGTDSGGNLYIASTSDHRVYKVDTTGNLTVFAGAGWCGYGGDNGPATQASLCYPSALAVDNAGNVYIADLNNVVRMVNASGIITTYAGNGSGTYSGDGVATSVGLCQVYSLATGGTNLYIGSSCSRVFRVDITGALTTIAGNGVAGYTGDGGPALYASMSQPQALAADAVGNVYFADTNNYRIRKIDPSGNITTLVGTGTAGYNNCQAATTAVSTPIGAVQSLAMDGSGNLYYEDLGSYCVLQVRSLILNPYVTPVAGTGTNFTGSPLGATAGATALSFVYGGLAVDGSGDLFISDYSRQQILEVVPAIGSLSLYYGPISVFAGNGMTTFAGNNVAATSARLNSPYGVTVDDSGNLYFADQQNGVVRKVDGNNVITTVAGVPGTCGSSGDGGPAIAAQLCYPNDVAIGPTTGNLYITDTTSVRVVDFVSGNISTYASSPVLLCPKGITIDSSEAVYVSDGCKQVVTKFTGGSGTTYAGVPYTSGFNGDGVAISRNLNDPAGLALDSAGNLYIADKDNYRVRKVDGSGHMTTVAGNGDYGYRGDNVSAVSTGIYPWGLAFDPAGNLLITELDSPRVRLVDGTGTIHTFAGTGAYGYSGDGSVAAAANMTTSFGIAVDVSGNVYLSDTGNNVVRQVSAIAVLDASTNSVVFPPQPLNVSSTPQSVVLTSFGPLNVASITIGGADSGDFAFSNSCGTSYSPAPGIPCTLSITFTPTQAGLRTGSIVVNDNAVYGSPLTISLSGTGLMPTGSLTLSSTAVNFFQTNLVSSNASPLSLTNYTAATVGIPAGAISTGSAAPVFSIGQDGCTGTALAVGKGCSFTVIFAPMSSGAQTGTLTVSLPGTNLSATLTGSGFQAFYTAPTTMAFGTQGLNVTSAPRKVNVYNNSGAALLVSIPASVGAYAASPGTCVNPILNNNFCSFTVTFTPTVLGAAAPATLYVGGTNLSLPLTGTGVAPFYLSPTSLVFVNEGLNVPSVPKTVTIYNYSGSTVTPAIPAADSTGMFTTAGASTCANLATNTSCNFTVTFNPGNTLGPISSQFSVTGFASPLTVSMTGTGVQPDYLFPTSLAFGNQVLNVPSAAKTVTIYNYSGKTVTPTIPAADSTGMFTTAPGTLSCVNLATNTSCNFNVIFNAGNTLGAASSQLSVTGFASPLTVGLTGTGVLPFYLSPTSLAFVNEGLNVPSASKTVTIYNYSGVTVTPTIPAADPTGMFTTAGTSACANLATSTSCNFTVIFTPNTTGAISSQLSVTGFASPLTVGLTGTGVQPFSLSPTSLAFGSEGLNVPSTPQTVTIYNYSGKTLTPTIPAADPTGLFTTAPGTLSCANLTTYKSCNFTVIFTPNTTGAISSQLSVTGFATPLSLPLTGTGVQPFYLSATSLAFVNEGLNVPSVAKTVTIYNYSGNTLTPTIPAADPTGMFTTTGASTCANLATNKSCIFSVTFNPGNTLGAISSQLSVTGFASPLTVSLTGTGVQPFYLSPTSLAFGNQGLNLSSAAKTVTIYNYSGNTLTPTIPATDPTGLFTTTGASACANLATNKSCIFSVIFNPGNSTGAISSQLSVTGFATPLTVGLTGTGVQPLYLSPTSLAFGSQAVGSKSASQTVYLYNYSGGTVTPSISSSVGAFTASAGSCANLVLNNGYCSFTVIFAPTVTGATQATLNVGGTSLSLTLTGTGK